MSATSRIARWAIDLPVDPYRLRFFIAVLALAAGERCCSVYLTVFSASQQASVRSHRTSASCTRSGCDRSEPVAPLAVSLSGRPRDAL